MGDAPLWRAHERISVQRASPWAVSIQFDNEGNVLNEALKDYKWDDSVKALVSSPQILERMDSQLEWMQQLGEAFLAQQKDTMDAVQRVRAKAQQPAQSYSFNSRATTRRDGARRSTRRGLNTRPRARLAPGGSALGDLSVLEPEPVQAAPTSFATLYEDWLQKYPALHAIRHGTLVGYRSFAEQHLVPFFGEKAVATITPRLIEDFIETKRAPGGSVRRVGKPLADGSLRTGLLTLRLIWQRGVRLGLITASPVNDIEWRGMPHMEQVDPFAGRELRAILTAAERLEPEFATLLRLWMQSGMRAGEVAGLQWQDVDLTTGLAKVRRTWSRQRLGPTKTGIERDVSVLHPIADDTQDWRPGATESARSVLHGLRRLSGAVPRT